MREMGLGKGLCYEAAFSFITIQSKEGEQGTYDSDSTCLYSAIAKRNMTINTKKLSIFFGSDM